MHDIYLVISSTLSQVLEVTGVDVGSVFDESK